MTWKARLMWIVKGVRREVMKRKRQSLLMKLDTAVDPARSECKLAVNHVTITLEKPSHH